MNSTSDTCPDLDPVDVAVRLAVAAERIGGPERENATLREALATSQETVAKLTTYIAELERRLELNSGKSPSSDGLKKPRRT